MLRTVLAVLAACLALGVLPALADEDYAETLLRQKIWDGYNEGWAVRTATTAELAQEEYRIYLVTLYAGNKYRILGVGDKGVSNLDLVLHDADGNTVSYDQSADPEPTLDFAPDTTATYFVVVNARTLTTGSNKAGVGMAVTYK